MKQFKNDLHALQYKMSYYPCDMYIVQCIHICLHLGESLTRSLYETELPQLIHHDDTLGYLPLRAAAISKLCELRVRAYQNPDSFTALENVISDQTKDIQIERRLKALQGKKNKQ